MHHFFYAAVFAAFLALTGQNTAHAAEELRIDRITPDGEYVPEAKQIVLTFNRAVVPVGRMERTAAEIPVTITPALPCEWRWINSSALACNLPDAAPMQPATRYKMVIKPGITAEDGGTIAKTHTHEFRTEVPATRYIGFSHWINPTLPVMRVYFNQPVTQTSVQKSLYLQKDGGDGAHIWIQAEHDTNEGNAFALGKNGAIEEIPMEDIGKYNSDTIARRVWLVQAAQALDEDTTYSLHATAGLSALIGPEKGDAAQQLFRLSTLPEFRFLRLSCTSLDDKTISIEAGQTPPEKGCDPMASAELQFSAPVTRNQLTALSFSPKIAWQAEDDGSDEANENSDYIPYIKRQEHTKGRSYSLYLPRALKAGETYTVQSSMLATPWYERWWIRLKSLFTKTAPLEVKDAFGRTLAEPLSVSFSNDNRRANYVLPYSHAVLEHGVDSELPLYVNNLEKYRFAYRAITSSKTETAKLLEKTVPNVRNIQFAVPMGLREMLGGKSGAVFGHLFTTPTIRNAPKSGERLFAQVTPFSIHLKAGHFRSIAWVTDLATGKPVADAKVSIFADSYTKLSNPKKIAGTAQTDDQGVAILPGINEIDPTMDLINGGYGDASRPRFFLQAEKDGEMGLLPVDYDYQTYMQTPEGEDYIWSEVQARYGHMRAWGATAQGIYRAGDKIDYKFFVRDQNNEHLTPAPALDYTLEITDPTGKTVHTEKAITLSEFGGYSGSFTTSKEASVGWYQFQLTASTKLTNAMSGEARESTSRFQLMRVLVSDFTTAPFKVKAQLNGDRFTAQDTIKVATTAELHSGGSYSDATARITAVLDSAPFRSTDPVAKAFTFDSFEYEVSTEQIYQTTSKVDARGTLESSFTPARPSIVYGNLTIESAVQDERGKFITGYSRAQYTGVDRLVGIRSPEWLYTSGKQAVLQSIVVDAAGKPVADTKVSFIFEEQVTKAARVKGAGNAYITEYKTEWEKAGECESESTIQAANCSFTPDKAGYYRARASIKDTHGTAHRTQVYFYVTGKNTVVWEDSENSALPIIPEQTGYKIGDTARFLIKNPYPGATALISIERYGVLDHWVQVLDGSTPVIEVPIKPDYVPGAYLSVVVTSPRVEKPVVPVGQVDLGKPAVRMGYLKLPVSDPYKNITVTSKTDKDVYKPGEEVTLELQATLDNPEDGDAPIELTVAVLDEAVLDLIAGGTSYYDPKSGMWRLENPDLKNYNLLTRLIGRQKFEKKGANPGGDGGSDLAMRSVFKFVSYWNPALKTDADGRAKVTFTVPDNLTGWRVLAIAATKADRFGLGKEGNFKVNRPTEIRPVMPNQVIEGDAFEAGFSVMNRTDTPRTLTVTITADGAVAQDAAQPATLSKEVALEPYQRSVIYLPLKAGTLSQTADTPKGEIRFTATAEDNTDGDGVTHRIPVNKYRAISSAATYGSMDTDETQESVLIPADAIPDTGSVRLALSPTVIGNIAGAFDYMASYPYSCWEQKLTKAVMASNYTRLRDYLPATQKWEEASTLPEQTLAEAANYQAPNGGMSYFKASDERVDPYLSAYTALAFHWLQEAGHPVPEAVEARLHAYLQNLLRNDAVPSHYSDGMRSTVRAVALAALTMRGKALDADIERYRPHLKEMSLLGKTLFLQAANQLDTSSEARIDAAKSILATSNQTGGKFQFAETLDDGYQQLLVSTLRENCMALSAFSQLAKRNEHASLVSDVPFKLVRFITQSRGARTHWANPQENVFCAQALADYAAQYEKDTPAMVVDAALGESSLGSAKFTSKRDETITLSKPVDASLIGNKQPLTIERNGKGRLYYGLQLNYALPPEKDVSANAGIELKREYSIKREGKWELIKEGEVLSRGDVVRVDLYLSLPAARNFVVVDDPVPGGLEPVNSQLANSSQVDAAEGNQPAGGAFWFSLKDWVDFGAQFWSFYHQEVRHDSVRYYSDYLPAGNYHLAYTAQAIANGTFNIMPSLAQEMYDPDVYGKTIGARLKIDTRETTAK